MVGDGPSSPRSHSSTERIDLEIGVFGAFPDLSQPRDAPALLRQACPIHTENAGRPWSAFVGRPKTERNARKPHFNANRKGKTAPAYRVYQTYAMTRQRSRDQGPSPRPAPGISHRTPGNVRRTRHGRFSPGANASFGSEGEQASTLPLDRPARRPPAPDQGPQDTPEAGGIEDGKPPTPGTAPVRCPRRCHQTARPIRRSPDPTPRPPEAGAPGLRGGQLIHSQYITRKQPPEKNGLRQ